MTENLDNTVFYDGYCNLCSNSIDFISKRDSGKFNFQPLDSEKADELKRDTDSVVLIDSQGQHYESEAVIRILKELKFPWNILGSLTSILPKIFLDKAYKTVARTRYRIFGRRKTCKISER